MTEVDSIPKATQVIVCKRAEIFLENRGGYKPVTDLMKHLQVAKSSWNKHEMQMANYLLKLLTDMRETEEVDEEKNIVIKLLLELNN